jgi:type II secretory pathway pseudopilin PulG
MARHTAVGKAHQRGFSYLWVMAALVIMGIYLSRFAEVSAHEAQRAREDELLRVGLAYQSAIRAFYQDGNSAQDRYPVALSDLLMDPRVPQPRRYLRKLYADPLTQSTDWGLILNAQRRIVGVYSIARGVPIRQAEFPDEFPGFSRQDSYRGWAFQYQPDVGLSGGRTR